MTVICALYDDTKNTVYLGCNSGALIGDVHVPEHKSKWVRFDDWAIAFSGHSRLMGYLQLERSKFPISTDEPHRVISFIRETASKYNLGEMQEGYLSFGCATLLVHKNGTFLDLDHKMTPSEIPSGTLWARGSGMEFALGADDAVKMINYPAEQRIQYAVDAAIKLDSCCPGDTIIDKM